VETRPDPDAILARIQSAAPTDASSPELRGRGRLKIFFGAAAGVGKTFAMLQEAQEKRRGGIEVVVGYVETHKRPETVALLEGLEALPPLSIDYRGVKLREFDLDAALARKPQLLLVDELAHTNAEGLRHTKRWHDVVELLDAGIDVYSTLNVQHIESLNDVVAQITGVVVRETLPDSIIERADEIELVDLPPDDLLERLREGKVYIPEQARRAVDSFFRRERLVALRELALRKTAERVNRQVQVERAGVGITRPWPTTDRLAVCVGPSPLSARVVRTAKRMAATTQSEWLALAVETPSLSATARESLRRNLRLAERLGAHIVTLSGERVAEEVLAFARTRNVTKIVIGKPARPRWRELLSGSIVDDLIRRSGDIDIHVVKGESEMATPAPPGPTAQRPPHAYAWTIVIMAACTGIAHAMFPFFSPVNLTMIYMAGVVLTAVKLGAGPAVFASILSPLLFNFFFTKPYYTFAVEDTQYIFTFTVMLVVGLIISGLTRRVQRQGQAVRTRFERTFALYFMTRMLATAADRDAVVRFAKQHIHDVFRVETAILLPDADGRLVLDSGGDSGVPNRDLSAMGVPAWVRSPREYAAAQWVFANGKWAGHGTETLPLVSGFYLPLMASGRPLGVLALHIGDESEVFEPDQRHMVETFATLTAAALERTRLTAEAEAARVRAETEQTRSTLLSCVSHDLRTPLATIAGAASTLLDSHRLADADRQDLLQSICDESARLNQLVGKLLEMTRLESGHVAPQREWYPLDDIVGSALSRLDDQLRQHQVETHIPADLPLVWVDGVLVEEVLVNLLENAARYAPPGAHVWIRVDIADGSIRVNVEDDGPGLTPGTEQEIFEKFVRSSGTGRRQGTGLGLPICRAIVRLHGGRIGAENRREGGARFWFTIPLASEAAQPTLPDLADRSAEHDAGSPH